MITYQSSISYSLPQPNSQTVLLIGTATQGPILAPVCGSGLQQVANCFGSGPLVDAYNDAYGAGGRYVYLVQIDPDSTSDADYLAALDNLLGYLLDLPFVNIYPAEFPVDSIEVVSLLATYCYNRMQRGLDSLVVAGFEPNSMSDWDTYLLNWMANNIAEFTINGVDISPCFSLVGAQFNRGTSFGQILSSGAGIYAGLVAANAPNVNLTNQNTNLSQVANSFSGTQCGALADAGIVSFIQTVRHGIAVYDGVTAAASTSVYHELYCYRTAVEVCERLNSIDRQYLGLAVGTPVNGVAMSNAVQSVLSGAIDDSLITDFSFSFTIVPSYNQVQISAIISVPGMVNGINVSTVVVVL
jgi:hypothetical protein